jgi:hypothetical protein
VFRWCARRKTNFVNSFVTEISFVVRPVACVAENEKALFIAGRGRGGGATRILGHCRSSRKENRKTLLLVRLSSGLYAAEEGNFLLQVADYGYQKTNCFRC